MDPLAGPPVELTGSATGKRPVTGQYAAVRYRRTRLPGRGQAPPDRVAQNVANSGGMDMIARVLLVLVALLAAMVGSPRKEAVR